MDTELLNYSRSKAGTSKKKGLTVLQITDTMDSEFEADESHKGDWNGVDIVMFPPDNNEISDGYSDDSEKPSGNIGRWSGRLLHAGGRS